MSSVIEFLVDQVFEQDNHLRIQGACNYGPIYKGDTFLLASKSEIDLTKILRQEEQNPPRLNVRKILLTVEKIITYHQEVDELPTGMSGELFVVGEGQEEIKPGDRIGI
jgi:hypothetical protein